MKCRKCGHQWFIRDIPFPRNFDCPNCGAPIFKDNIYIEATSAEIARAQETRCRVCGRLLTAPLSVERGIGPVCWARLQRNHTLEEYPEEDSVLATKNLLQRHQGTLTCRGCDQPILEGAPIVKRRVNSRARYYHQGCIYTEKKTEEAEGQR